MAGREVLVVLREVKKISLYVCGNVKSNNLGLNIISNWAPQNNVLRCTGKMLRMQSQMDYSTTTYLHIIIKLKHFRQRYKSRAA